MSENERAAHEYADHGWPVFPLAEGSKIPAIPSAHDRGSPCAGECGNDGHGFRDASTDHARISAWWKGHPDRNIGVATGERSFDVLDIDQGKAGKPSGFKALNELKRAGLIPQYRSAIQTPGGGLHLVFKGSDQRSSRLPDHSVDLRSEGGYVAVAPSTVGGKPYVVAQRNHVEPAKVDWQAIVSHLQPQREKPVQHSRVSCSPDKELENLARWVEAKGPGDRNGSLYWAACRGAEKGLLNAEGRERLIQAAEVNGLRGGRREAERTIDSALRSASLKVTGQREAGS